MTEVIVKNWYLFLGFMLAGAMLALGTQQRCKNLIKIFQGKAPLIKKNWLLVVPFAILSVVAYILTIKLSPSQSLNNNISLLNQATTLIFAIFAGYLAFQQLVEYRKDKLKEQASIYFKQPSYLRAIQYYEEAYRIDPKDFSLLSELLEVYLCAEDFKKFDEKIPQLERLVVENYEKSIVAYLKICKNLFNQDLKSTRSELKAYLDLVKNNSEVLPQFRFWDFSDIRKSAAYKKLEGDIKVICDNFLTYLNKALDDEKKNKFENKNYLLKDEEKK